MKKRPKLPHTIEIRPGYPDLQVQCKDNRAGLTNQRSQVLHTDQVYIEKHTAGESELDH